MENENKSEFAKNYGELAEINSWFRRDDIDIEEGLAKLKRGTKLIEKCQKRLGEIENEFMELTKGLVTDDGNKSPLE